MVRDQDKAGIVDVARDLVKAGFELIATDGTQAVIAATGLACERVRKMQQGQPNILDQIKNNAIDLIINTTHGRQAIEDSYYIRQEALGRKIPYTTTLSGASAICAALQRTPNGPVYRLSDIHQETA